MPKEICILITDNEDILEVNAPADAIFNLDVWDQDLPLLSNAEIETQLQNFDQDFHLGDLEQPVLVIMAAIRSDDCPVDIVTDQLPSYYRNLGRMEPGFSDLCLTKIIDKVCKDMKDSVPCQQISKAGIPFTLENPRIGAPPIAPTTPHQMFKLKPCTREEAVHAPSHPLPILHQLLVISLELKIHVSMHEMLATLPEPFRPENDPSAYTYLTWFSQLRFLAAQPPSFWVMRKYVDLASKVTDHYHKQKEKHDKAKLQQQQFLEQQQQQKLQQKAAVPIGRPRPRPIQPSTAPIQIVSVFHRLGNNTNSRSGQQQPQQQ